MEAATKLHSSRYKEAALDHMSVDTVGVREDLVTSPL